MVLVAEFMGYKILTAHSTFTAHKAILDHLLRCYFNKYQEISTFGGRLGNMEDVESYFRPRGIFDKLLGLD